METIKTVEMIEVKCKCHYCLQYIQVGNYDDEVDMYERLIIKMKDYHNQTMKKILEED